MSENNGQPNIKTKPVESTQRGTRLNVNGTGIRQSIEELESLTTFFPIFYHPEDGVCDVGLIQGGVQVGAVENGLAITYDAPFGHYLRRDQRTILPTDRQGKPQKRSGQWERDAFSYGYYAFLHALNMVKAYTDQIVTVRHQQPSETEKFLTIVVNEIQALEDRVMISLVDTFARSFRLRDDRSYFRNIGLAQVTDHGSVYPSTIMKIPNVIEGTRNVFLRAGTVPYQPGTSQPVLPMDVNIFHIWHDGVMHAFENQVKYEPACAIRSAMFHSTWKEKYGINTLLAGASRCGIFPRLGSQDNQGNFLWQKLAALAMVHKYYGTYYNASQPDVIGEMRYIFSGTGLTKVLEQLISMYIESSMLAVQTQATNTKTGVFFMPATNSMDASFCLAFFNDPKNVERDAMVMNISDLRSKLYWHYAEDTVRVADDGFIDVTEEQMHDDKWRSMTIVPIHTVREKKLFLGAGFERRTLEITDTYNDEKWDPSEMVETLTLGWKPRFSPKSVILRNTQTPSRLEELRGFELLRVNEEKGAKSLKSPWVEGHNATQAAKSAME